MHPLSTHVDKKPHLSSSFSFSFLLEDPAATVNSKNTITEAPIMHASSTFATLNSSHEDFNGTALPAGQLVKVDWDASSSLFLSCWRVVNDEGDVDEEVVSICPSKLTLCSSTKDMKSGVLQTPQCSYINNSKLLYLDLIFNKGKRIC